MSTRYHRVLMPGMVALVLSATGMGCGHDGPGRGSGVLDGYVYLRGSSDHSGTLVRLTGWRSPTDTTGGAVTDSSGYYVLEGVPDGEWVLKAMHPWYFEAYERAVIKRGLLVSPMPDIYLSKALWGNAYLEGQDDHIRICVTMGTGSRVASTGSDGSYLLPPMDDGDYILTLSFEGYETVERPITILDGLAHPPLGDTTLTTTSLPVIVDLADFSEPSSNPIGLPADVALTVYDEAGVVIWEDEMVVDDTPDELGCVSSTFAIPGLLSDTPYDIVLRVPRYFILGRFDGAGAFSDSLVINDVIRGENRGERLPLLALYSYYPNQVYVVVNPELERSEVEELVSNLGCTIIVESWNSYYKAPEYSLHTPEGKTEWEMVDTFMTLSEILYASVEFVNEY
jgi:hypothetical protein